MTSVIIVIHLVLVIALVAVILLQKSEGGGLGIGSTGGFLSSRGTANVLTRTTAYLGLAFFGTSLALSWIASFDRKPASILTGAPPAQNQPAPGNNAPLAPGGGGLLKQLQQNEAPAQPAPAQPPSGPQVPQSQ